MLHYNRIDIREGSDPSKGNDSKNIWFATISFLIMGLNFKILFVVVATI